MYNRSIFEKVEEFNKKITKAYKDQVTDKLDESEEKWLISAFKEEIEEYINAKNLTERIDAIIDLIYYAAGALSRHGIPYEVSEKIFNKIHECNMRKKHGSRGRRAANIEQDAYKPENWIGPEEFISNEIKKLKIKKNKNKSL